MVLTEGVARATAPEAKADPVNPSCDGRAGAGNDCQGVSCCERISVPGGTFLYAPDNQPAVAEVVVNGFALDKYEVTVGRFRTWLAAGAPVPANGSTVQYDLDGEPIRWSHGHTLNVQRTKASLSGWRKYDTFTRGAATAPKNSVNWYTAMAFCRWDGGRLPTEHEWKYVAEGGAEQRRFPWGGDYPTFEHAVYNCQGDGIAACTIHDLLPVGSKPKGASRWGHMDLAGSLFEWTVAHQRGRHGVAKAKSRGGGFCYIGGDDRRAPLGLQASTARLDDLAEVSHMVGVRCAYEQ